MLLLNIKLVLLKLLTASGTIVSPVNPAPPVASRGVCPLSLLLTNGENCEHIIHREAPAEGRRMMYEVQTDKRPTWLKDGSKHREKQANHGASGRSTLTGRRREGGRKHARTYARMLLRNDPQTAGTWCSGAHEEHKLWKPISAEKKKKIKIKI